MRSKYQPQNQTAKLPSMLSDLQWIDTYRPESSMVWAIVPVWTNVFGSDPRMINGPSQISDISESQDELLVDAILARRSSIGTHSLLRVWTRDQRFQLHSPTHDSTLPSIWISRDPP